MTNPIDNASAFDVCTIGNVVTNPQIHGLPEVFDANFRLKWSHVTGPGLDEAVSLCMGTDVLEFGIRFLFYEGSQIDGWFSEIAPLLKRPTANKDGKTISTLRWHHPLTSRPPISVTNIGIKSVSQLKRVDDSGLWCVELQVFSWKPIKPAPPKPIKDTDEGKPKPADTADALNARLFDQVDFLFSRAKPGP